MGLEVLNEVIDAAAGKFTGKWGGGDDKGAAVGFGGLVVRNDLRGTVDAHVDAVRLLLEANADPRAKST